MLLWVQDNWIERNVDSSMVPTFQLCGNEEDETGPRYAGPKLYVRISGANRG